MNRSICKIRFGTYSRKPFGAIFWNNVTDSHKNELLPAWTLPCREPPRPRLLGSPSRRSPPSSFEFYQGKKISRTKKYSFYLLNTEPRSSRTVPTILFLEKQGRNTFPGQNVWEVLVFLTIKIFSEVVFDPGFRIQIRICMGSALLKSQDPDPHFLRPLNPDPHSDPDPKVFFYFFNVKNKNL